jgi:putative transcriptional regulator
MNVDGFNIFIPDNKLKAEKGRLLISEPLSADSFFSRSLVLLTEHNEKDGSIGYILNKPTSYRLNDLLNTKYQYNPKVCFGGPVQPETLHFIHTFGDKLPGSMHIKGDLYWSGDFDIIKMMAEQNLLNENNIRFFVGYSGWAPGQLDDELRKNFWLIEESDDKFIMTNYDKDSWKYLLLQKGDKYKSWLNVPINPTFN